MNINNIVLLNDGLLMGDATIVVEFYCNLKAIEGCGIVTFVVMNSHVTNRSKWCHFFSCFYTGYKPTLKQVKLCIIT